MRSRVANRLRAQVAAAFAVVGLGASSCITTSLNPTGNSAVKTHVNYDDRINAYSDGEAEYVGFYNNFDFRATLLNGPIREALIDQQAGIFQWDPEKRSTEREKSFQEMASTTTVFMSFYTPERRNDNLGDPKSIWRVYLETGGRRYQGKVTRLRTPLPEVQALYPYHSRWNSAYSMEFPIPTTAIEGQGSALTVTGPLGSKTVNFSAVR